MGIIVNTYRTAGIDCTNGGLSAHYDTFVVVNVDGPFDPAPTRPAMWLREHPAGKQYPKHLVPAAQAEDGTWGPADGWWMFGGNIADTSDSRWSKATAYPGFVTGVPMHIHDRQE